MAKGQRDQIKEPQTETGHNLMYWTCFSFRRMIYTSYILAAENHTLINGYFRQGCLACRFKLREKRLRNCVGGETINMGDDENDEANKDTNKGIGTIQNILFSWSCKAQAQILQPIPSPPMHS